MNTIFFNKPPLEVLAELYLQKILNTLSVWAQNAFLVKVFWIFPGRSETKHGKLVLICSQHCIHEICYNASPNVFSSPAQFIHFIIIILGLPTMAGRSGEIWRCRKMRGIDATKLSSVRWEIRRIVPCGVVVDQTVPYEHWIGQAVRHTQAIKRIFAMFTNVTFLFVSVILEPDFYLCWREANHSRQMFPFWCGEIPLLSESALQFKCLCLSEEYAAFSFLLFRLRGFLSLEFRTRQRFRFFFCRKKEKTY
jgi:hypothetical protein